MVVCVLWGKSVPEPGSCFCQYQAGYQLLTGATQAHQMLDHLLHSGAFIQVVEHMLWNIPLFCYCGNWLYRCLWQWYASQMVLDSLLKLLSYTEKTELLLALATLDFFWHLIPFNIFSLILFFSHKIAKKNPTNLCFHGARNQCFLQI